LLQIFLIKGFNVSAFWQKKTVNIIKVIHDELGGPGQFLVEVDVLGNMTLKSLVAKPEGLSSIVVIYQGEEVPLADFDWSWKARFKRIRHFLGHSYETVASITGNKTVSIHRVVSSKDFPRNLRYAVQVWEEMYFYAQHKL
jgi:hypothetical protein